MKINLALLLAVTLFTASCASGPTAGTQGSLAEPDAKNMPSALVAPKNAGKPVTKPVAKIAEKHLPVCGSRCENSVTRVYEFDEAANECVYKLSYPCQPWTCDDEGFTCRTGCETNAECTAGSVCNWTRKECVPQSYSCKNAFDIVSADGKETSCAPYRCAAGTCREQCRTDVDCSPGYECDSKTQGCVKD
jgi:hypothetical protein